MFVIENLEHVEKYKEVIIIYNYYLYFAVYIYIFATYK